jgi:hypothetical protein
MPDRALPRGPHPDDSRLFGEAYLPALRAATREVSWLLDKGYTLPAALKLAGDRHALNARQRAAVSRCACADQVALERQRRLQPAAALAGAALLIDAFNVLTTIEVALSGGVVMIGRDGVMRDIAGVHGSYRSLEETEPAVVLVQRTLSTLEVDSCEWLLDAPVANSGKLCALLNAQFGPSSLARVVPDPDPLLASASVLVASADGQVLDAAARSCNLARLCVERELPAAFTIDLSVD